MAWALRHPWFWVVLFLLIALIIFHFAANSAAAQAVQLPTFNYFTVNTTVEVPDGGDALLGGIGRSSSGRIDRGIPGLPSRPFLNSALTRSTGAGNVSVSAQIHDLDAMDRALLGADPATIVNRVPFHPPLGLAQQDAVTSSAAATPSGSIAAIKAEAAAKNAAKEKEAAESLARGKQLLTENRAGIAKIYLQNAARHASGQTREQALAALKSIDQGTTSSRVAGR